MQMQSQEGPVCPWGVSSAGMEPMPPSLTPATVPASSSGGPQASPDWAYGTVVPALPDTAPRVEGSPLPLVG